MSEALSFWPDFGMPPLPGSPATNGKKKAKAKAPDFAAPMALKLSEEEREKIVEVISDLVKRQIEARESWTKRHNDYDLMFRGALDLRGPDAGPWPESSNLHVQMPYWCVAAYNTRLVSGLWSQVPLVVGHPTEDDDVEAAKDAAKLVNWHLSPRRMNAREAWSRISKTRCIHGRGVGSVPWATDEFVYREQGRMEMQRGEDGRIVLDEEDLPIESEDSGKVTLKRKTRYDGPLLVPHEWDDIIEPFEGINLQPVTRANPLGADWVGVRGWEPLSLIWQKRDTSYPYIDDTEELDDKDKWVNSAPSQDRSGSGAAGSTNQSRARLQDYVEGRSRNEGTSVRSPRARPNPEFEVITWYMPWEIENDTIHNMRVDVGFATNMPFFFFRATSSINPERIVLRPGKGIPVDDVRDVQFPQLQSVTSFYYQEENLIYSLAERVLGITDLFLGVSPTRGAASRHATGFVGTQQEAMARTEEVMNSDATQFSFLSHLVYESEIQFGPPERILRLQGREGPLTQELTRDELWMRGEHDFTVGANHGLYSSMMRQQQSQVLTQAMQMSPLINADPGRRWEAENEIFLAAGFDNPELYIGPKSAVSQGTPKPPEEENGEMDQHIYGVGIPAPVHPSDNDGDHMRIHNDHLNSEAYIAMGRPNLRALLTHIQMTQAQMLQKQQAQQMAMQNAAMGGAPPGGPPGPGGQPNARNVASLQGVEQSGAGGDVNASPVVNNQPNMGGRPPMGANGQA
jgi:hypothetical protein